MHLKKFSPEDIVDVEELEKRSFEVGPYSREELVDLFNFPGAFNLLLYDGNRLAGYVVAVGLDEASANIESIAVDPDLHGKGIGSVLLKGIEEEMVARGYRVCVLEVREKNDQAIGFYNKHGYRASEVLENFYSLNFKGSRHGLRLMKKLV